MVYSIQLVIGDLSSVDERIVSYFDYLRGLDEQTWVESRIRWCIRNGAGRLVRVVALRGTPDERRFDGDDLDPSATATDSMPVVAFADRANYLWAAEQLRLHEFDRQVQVSGYLHMPYLVYYAPRAVVSLSYIYVCTYMYV